MRIEECREVVDVHAVIHTCLRTVARTRPAGLREDRLLPRKRLCVLCVIGGLHNRGSWNFIGGIRYVGGGFRGFGAGRSRSRSVDKPSFGLLKGVFLEERRVAVVERAGGIVDAMIGWKGWLCGSVCRITRQRTLLTDGGIALIYRTGWHGEKSAYPHRWQIQSPEEDCEYYLVSVR